MRKILISFLVAGFLFSCKDKKEEPAKDETMVKTSATEEQSKASEFADEKYMAWGKQRQQQFQDGDIDTWAQQFADNAVYIWSSGDSLAGKQAIIDYWKNRRKNVIQSVTFSNDIWLPIKVNKPQKGPDLPGVWLLSWYQVNATYKTGKSLQFWVHTDLHFNNEDKVDRLVQYIDRAPINAAVNAK
jgi:hypothetical protein